MGRLRQGGAIKRLVASMDPRHVRVVQIAAPTPDELRHHWLQRFWPELPGWGGVVVLDRSWYGRVLVERVEGFATAEQWRRAYTDILDYERTLVDEGTDAGSRRTTISRPSVTATWSAARSSRR